MVLGPVSVVCHRVSDVRVRRKKRKEGETNGIRRYTQWPNLSKPLSAYL